MLLVSPLVKTVRERSIRSRSRFRPGFIAAWGKNRLYVLIVVSLSPPTIRQIDNLARRRDTAECPECLSKNDPLLNTVERIP